jgi:hypothetical protein
MKKILTIAALAVLGAAALPRSAQAQSAVTYTPGDLFLSFRASDGVGATQNYVVNLGQASGFGATGSSAVVTAAGDIATDLTTLFGADWKTRSDVFWSVSGTVGSFNPVGSDPAKTLYATREELVPGTLATPWLRRSDTTQGVTTSKMNAMANAYHGKTSTAANSKAIIQSTSAANSYASFQPGGTLENSGPAPGISFAAFNPTIEGRFASGTAGSVLDLVRLAPASGADIGTAGAIVGRFTLSDSGELRYTPAAAVGASSVAVALASYSVTETAGTVGVKLVRSGDPSTAFTVNVSTADGTAIAGTDYTALSSVTVSFAVNQTEVTVPVSILNVPGTQADRSFTVSIASPSGATLGAQTSASVTISDAVVNSQIAFSASTYAFSAVNNAGDPNSLSVQLTRTGGSTGSVAIGVAVTGGTLVNGTDYQTYSPQTVTFADGVTTATTTIQLNALTGGGSIVLGLSNPTGGAGLGAPASATLNVAAFSGTLSFASATYQKAEGTGDVTVQVSVTRGVRSVGAVSAEVAVASGTALVNLDYTLPGSIVLSWADGDNTPKTFDVTIKADTVLEAAGETVVLELRNLTGGAILGRDATTTLTIVDGDAKLPTLSVLKPSSNGTVTGSEAIVSGKATDNTGVSRVEVKLNGGSAQLATLTGPATSVVWSLSLLPEQGTNTLEVTAYDPAGNASSKTTRKFTFKNLRPALAGSYNGLLVAGAGATSQIDQNGLVNLTVTSTGSFTGRVTIAGVSQAISGVFKNDGSAAFGKTSAPTIELVKTLKPAKVSLGFLALTLDTGSGYKVTGALKDAAGAVTFASVVADKALYTSAKNPVLPLRNVPQGILDPAREKGKYTALFLAADSPNSGVAKTGFPQGDGYAMVTVSTSGKVTMKGKLADGSTVSYSNALSSTNDLPVYVQLYGKKGFVAGNVRFDSTQTTSDAAGLGMKWFKPAGLTSPKNYTAGWPNGILTDFVASKFIPTGKPSSKVPVPPNPDTVLGVGVPGASAPTVANLLIGVADGGLTTATTNDASLSAVNKLSVLGATSGQTGATGLKASFSASSGALSGSFVHPGTNKSVSFAGVVYQKQNSASGFFLYTPPTSNPSAIPESGSVSVSKK